eukprot:1148733-Pelagomonas_calceolata.AAC.2
MQPKVLHASLLFLGGGWGVWAVLGPHPKRTLSHPIIPAYLVKAHRKFCPDPDITRNNGLLLLGAVGMNEQGEACRLNAGVDT